MSEHVIIDGNNLLHAVFEHASRAHLGRETLVRLIARWVHPRPDRVTVVFDGGAPPEGLVKQMSSSRVVVQFSGGETADDVIIRMVHEAAQPTGIRVVSSDGVIRHAARYRRCACSDSAAFVAELFGGQAARTSGSPAPTDDQSAAGQVGHTRDWLDTFDIDIDDEPFDGYDAMAGAE